MATSSLKNGHIAGIASMMEGKVNLPATTAEIQVKYKTARPFPYLVLDNLFPNDQLEEMLAELPPLTDDKWVHDRNEQSVKSNLRSAVDLGPAGYQFAAFLNSAAFLYLLSEMTDIWGLLGDPYLGGAGYHVVPAGGKFNVHADRNTDMSTGLLRRLAMLTYLNHDWDPDFGGQLELWDTEAKACQEVVQPIFNRTVIMQIGDQNFHAVRPVITESRSRVSFATYFHTVGAKDLKPHSSIYAPSFYSKKESRLKRLAENITPPFVMRTFRPTRKQD